MLQQRNITRKPRVSGVYRCVVLSLAITGLSVGLSACAQRSEPAPVESVYSGRTIYDFTKGSLSAPTYQVQQGDTLYSIAFRAELDLRDIARLNNLSEPYQIHPGKLLRLRADRPVTRTASVKEASRRPEITPKSVKERKETASADLTPPIVSTTEQEYGESRAVQKTSSTSNVQAQPQPAARLATTSSHSGNIEWLWPSQGRITQRFRSDRPGASGIIFSGVKGDPVTAAAAGKVVYVGSALRGFGRLIILKHNDDFITAYAHNDQLLVREQEWVAAGQQIATMGDSDTDEIRLRFELRYQGSSVNPEQYLPRSR